MQEASWQELNDGGGGGGDCDAEQILITHPGFIRFLPGELVERSAILRGRAESYAAGRLARRDCTVAARARANLRHSNVRILVPLRCLVFEHRYWHLHVTLPATQENQPKCNVRQHTRCIPSGDCDGVPCTSWLFRQVDAPPAIVCRHC